MAKLLFEQDDDDQNSQGKDEKKIKAANARAKSLSKKERSDIAKKAATARWSPDIPKATHGDLDHPLTIGEIKIPCYVLEDGRRVLHQRGMVDAIGMARGSSGGTGGDRLAKFVGGDRLKQFISDQLREVTESPIKFKTARGMLAYGYEATVLADICDAVLAARKAGLLQKQQLHIAEQCEILVRGFARVGIIALVDEATGYQYDRARAALAEILEKFIKDELGKWAKRFPDDFYRQLFRLKGLDWPSEKNPPQYVGHWTNNIVYSRLAPGVLEDLKKKSPKTEKWHRKNKFHQWLTDDVGHPKLQEHLSNVIFLMKTSDDWDDFEKRLNKGAPKYKQMPLFAKSQDANGNIPTIGDDPT